MVPGATAGVAVLVNQANPMNVQTTLPPRTNQPRPPAPWGCKSRCFNASNSGEIDRVFATLARELPEALFVGGDPFFNSRRVQLVVLATRHGLLATSSLTVKAPKSAG